MSYDLKSDGTPTGVKTALGFWPLLPHVASQAESLLTHLQNPAALDTGLHHGTYAIAAGTRAVTVPASSW
jgi:hypothetical protein